eukprot:10728637-Karenia_brevis.AAC.1
MGTLSNPGFSYIGDPTVRKMFRGGGNERCSEREDQRRCIWDAPRHYIGMDLENALGWTSKMYW